MDHMSQLQLCGNHNDTQLTHHNHSVTCTISMHACYAIIIRTLVVFGIVHKVCACANIFHYN